MNIFLIPYTWMRHVSVALVCAGATLLAWWLVLAVAVLFPVWTVEWDGAMYITALCVAVAGASTLAEASLRREPLWKRILRTCGSATISGILAMAGYWSWHGMMGPLIFDDVAGADLVEPTLISLRYRVAGFLFAGVYAGVGPLVFRKGAGFFAHMGAGAAAGLMAGATWYVLGYPKSFIGLSDLYLASAGGALAFGSTFGLLAWGIPDSLYAGWMRIVSETRHGRRIPIDAPDGGARERFLGHFPRGLDLFLPAEDGVMELHISVMVTRKQEYRARGLTLKPTLVRRFLERIDLRYDARRPAPLETKLSSGDRLLLGPPNDPTVIEFIMLPREER
ncbi:MAG: hypothetical protein Q8P41_04605 [Pseudomonadota bacterium]|nr:hypothetical protein [Pseudomonadota bacterium]